MMHTLTRVISVMWVLLFAAIVQASPIVDQQHTPSGNFPALAVARDRTQIQTFTVGITGMLTRIDVQVSRLPLTVEDLVLSLWSTDATGLPQTRLATASVAPTDPAFTIPGPGTAASPLIPFDLTAGAVEVTAGELLAIVLNSNAANAPPLFDERYLWEIGGQYERGTAYTQIGSSIFVQSEGFHFRTFVTVPAAPFNVNSELSGRVKPGTSTFNPQPVSDGLAGTFSFTAEFCNIGDERLIFLKSVTAVLTGRSVLLNRDSSTPPGVGSELTFAANREYTDLTLDGGECVDVPYVIGLARRAPFEFFVDVLGVISNDTE